jgi:hypothetical protein
MYGCGSSAAGGRGSSNFTDLISATKKLSMMLGIKPQIGENTATAAQD